MKFDLKSLLKLKKSGRGGDGTSAPAKSLPPQVEKALIWVKANLLLVVLTIASAGAIGGGWWYQDEWRTQIEEEAKKYAGKGAELTRLQSTEFTIAIPGTASQTHTSFVNRALVDAVKQRMNQGGSDSASIRRDAVAHNRGAHEPVINLRLPAKSPQRESLHQDFFAELEKQYVALLLEVNAGSPPSEEDVTIKLQRRQGRFLQTDLKKAADATLTTEERNQLQPVLVSHRLGLYSEVAQSKGIYGDIQDIGMPLAQPAKADFQRMWRLQWQLWIAQDILRACKSVNGSNKIPDAPIKRIVKIQFLGPVVGVGSSATAGAAGDSEPEGDPTATPEDAQAGGLAINPSAPVAMTNFAASRKGWTTNQLYDVFKSQVTLIVETTSIPQVSNAFSKQNFIVITDIKIRPADHFAAAAEGFIYGRQAVSELTLTMESAWLREWTGPLMPDKIRTQLNTSGALIGLEQDSETEPTKEN
ncbi:MAG: hypothetical protein EXS17_08130 [Phycisphaerales bacterium]|nr:hypothetical protein [Phycisphaerales bacterium]